ncbi:M23 family metallopeptidase [Chitinophaga deserti]|uniref:M23 family metallopeptidase n=1 Tax=Chitinophaga deserti TaxID=2164099 RepID=UPI000D6AA06F|nr:M23 family metallopeptidase [Chitinophaga deserti]
MITYLLLGLTVGLALWSILMVRRGARRPFPDIVYSSLVSLALAAFVYLYGTWVYGSIYLKYVFGGLYVCLFCYFLIRRKTDLPRRTPFVRLTFFVLLTLAVVLYFTGTTGTPRTVELDFPMKKGRYFVLQGGKGLPSNVFHFSLRGAIYAMDIVRLNDWGNRANTVFSKNLEDYAIFGDTVYSPCSGRIIRAHGDDPDNIPPNMKRGPKNTNAVLIDAGEYYVFMGHLKQGSVIVKEGDEVKTGQPMACVGNSGFSTEPHLHIQVHRKEKGKPWYASEPLYINFNGHGYLLNEMIRKKHLK